MKKAVSQAMWIIVVIVIALVIALALITVVNKTATNAETRGNSIIDIFGDSLKSQSCDSACAKCREISAGACPSDDPVSKKCNCS